MAFLAISIHIEIDDGKYDPDTTATISRGVGKCPNYGNVIDNEYISSLSTALHKFVAN